MLSLTGGVSSPSMPRPTIALNSRWRGKQTPIEVTITRVRLATCPTLPYTPRLQARCRSGSSCKTSSL